MLDLVTNSFLSKLASHEYHASKPIPAGVKRKFGLKKERREYESEKPVPEEQAEELGLEKEQHKEAAFMGSFLHKLARWDEEINSLYDTPPAAHSAYRPNNRNRDSDGPVPGVRGNFGRPRGQDRPRESGRDRERPRDSDRGGDRRGLTLRDVERVVNSAMRGSRPRSDEEPRSSASRRITPQDIVIDMPQQGPSALGRMATFGGAGALANLLLGDDEQTKEERALKGALVGAGLGGVYHLLRR